MTPSDAPNDPTTEGRAPTDVVGELGRLLRTARDEKGLDLQAIAGLTHVRQDYLRALETGRFADLPEDVYTRNFVRLYARTVGLSPDVALDAYDTERRRAGGFTAVEEQLARGRQAAVPPSRSAAAPRGAERPAQRERRERRRGAPIRVGGTLMTLVLVAALMGLGVWGYNRLFSRPSTQGASATPGVTTPGATQEATTGPSTGDPATAGGTSRAGTEPGTAGGDGAGAATDSGTVLISVSSEPQGARVTIDGFQLPGLTPITDAPVSARQGRVLRLMLDGYEPWEEVVDLTGNASYDVDLAVASVATVTTGNEPVAQGQIAIAVSAPSWLEVYRSSARNEGERLVYTTAQPGDSYTFDLPVYVYVGNAAGVEVTVGDGPPTVMGSSGAIVGQAFD